MPPFIVLFVVLALVVVAPVPASTGAESAPTARCRSAVPWPNARRVVGRVAEIKGRVVETAYARMRADRPTFLYVGRVPPHPKRFTVVIPGRDRSAFGVPEERYRGRTICVIGHVSLSRGVPQIEATTPAQIRIVR